MQHRKGLWRLSDWRALFVEAVFSSLLLLIIDMASQTDGETLILYEVLQSHTFHPIWKW